jgi:hypothetical protein
VTVIAVRRAIERKRRRLSVAAAILLVSGLLAWAHGAGTDHMGADGIGQPAAICLAILGGAGVFVGVAGLARRLRQSTFPRSANAPLAAAFAIAPRDVATLPRAGPAVLQVFLR